VKPVLKEARKTKKEDNKMSYLISIAEPEEANEELENSYDKLLSMFHSVPKVFMAQSIRPDLLAPLIVYVDRLMFETHALPRRTKELIAAYISKLNACAY
jgi:protoheme ferro-lyase